VRGVRSVKIVVRHGQLLSRRLPTVVATIVAWPTLGSALIGALGLYSPAWAQSTLPPLQVEAKKPAAKPAKKKTAVPKSDPAPKQTLASQKLETSTGSVDGYVATVTGTGGKIDTPLLLTPQSISVITADQIKDQGAQSVIEALRYTSGVSVELNSDTRYDETYIRGFRAIQYLDGMPVPLNQFFGTPRIEPYALERIEVLKGPASFLFGQNSPGGLLNMISKRPTEEAQNEVQLQYGSFNHFQTNFDFSGPATKDGKILYRLTGTVRDAETVVDYTRDDVFYIAPAVTWRPSADTSLTVLAHYGFDKGTFPHQYLPPEGTLLPGKFGRLSRSLFLGEPGFDRFDREQWALGYEFEHRLNDTWRFRQNLRYASVDTFFQAHRIAGFHDFDPSTPILDSDGRTVDRGAFAVAADAGTLTVDNHLQADFATGALRHKALVGVDYLRTTGNFAFSGTASFTTIDLYNPVYGTPVPPLTPFSINRTELTQVGVYAQDQIKLGNWLLTLGGRQDWVESTLDNLLAPGSPPKNRSDAAFTGRAGLTYVLANGLAPYVSYATSFQPVVDDINIELLEPTTGRQYEAGIKYQPAGSNLLITAAVFDITQQNFLTYDPEPPFTPSQIGEVRVRGFDIEARAKLTRNIDLLASYAYLDSEITDSINKVEIGRQVPLVAPHAAKAWAKYTFTEGPLAGLWIGGGVRYTGPTIAETTSAKPLEIPGYTLFDAGMAYDLGRLDRSLQGMELAVNVTNLFDEYHVAGYCDRTFCSLGAGRTVLATLSYRW
jgi:iron complex outermembrane recepter protein